MGEPAPIEIQRRRLLRSTRVCSSLSTCQCSPKEATAMQLLLQTMRPVSIAGLLAQREFGFGVAP